MTLLHLTNPRVLSMEEAVARDTPTLMQHLSEMNGKLGDVKDHVNMLQNHVQSSDVNSKSGLLELKNKLLIR